MMEDRRRLCLGGICNPRCTDRVECNGVTIDSPFENGDQWFDAFGMITAGDSGPISSPPINLPPGQAVSHVFYANSDPRVTGGIELVMGNGIQLESVWCVESRRRDPVPDPVLQPDESPSRRPAPALGNAAIIGAGFAGITALVGGYFIFGGGGGGLDLNEFQ
jgi:hypothetical protein